VCAACPAPAGRESLHSKVVSNIQEVRARGAITIVIAEEGDEAVTQFANHVIRVPQSPTLMPPPLATATSSSPDHNLKNEHSNTSPRWPGRTPRCTTPGLD